MSNLCKPTKFAHLQKLANQSTLNGTHVIEITKACTVALMKARNFLIFRCREKRVNGKNNRSMAEIYFLNLLLIDFG